MEGGAGPARGDPPSGRRARPPERDVHAARRRDGPGPTVPRQGTDDAERRHSLPPGTETAWAYTHVPQRVRRDAGGTVAGVWDAGDTEQFVTRMEGLVEDAAPGFRELVRGRHVF